MTSHIFLQFILKNSLKFVMRYSGTQTGVHCGSGVFSLDFWMKHSITPRAHNWMWPLTCSPALLKLAGSHTVKTLLKNVNSVALCVQGLCSGYCHSFPLPTKGKSEGFQEFSKEFHCREFLPCKQMGQILCGGCRY